MNLFEEIDSQQELVNSLPCPKCEEDLIVRTVKKENRNHGREFISCDACNVFEWLDLPACKTCHRRLYEAKAKKTQRWFRACPSGCKASFKWLTESEPDNIKQGNQ